MLYVYGYSLKRLGRIEESNRIFHTASNYGIHPSFWQRSSHYAKGLKSTPVWTLYATGISKELIHIAKNWRRIRREALSVLRKQSFVDQTEGIRDTGRWGIYQLYDNGKRF